MVASNVVLETVPLGMQWPTIDPFLFCVHHDDRYPAGNGSAGPAASLAGRPLGNDFEGIDGWRMYHGTTVPGFPAHPHRGFETVTYVRQGLIDHSDSLGCSARFGRGDVQWLTAGRGIVHSEMFPLLETHGPNPAELFQIWLNLPAHDKLVDPYFTMLWSEDLLRRRFGSDGASVVITVVAGALDGSAPPTPPPNSWAANPDADVAIWHLEFDSGAQWQLPPAASARTRRTLYCFAGSGIEVDGTAVGARTAAVLDPMASPVLGATDGPAECLLLQGRPIGEPVAQYGPFVMNTRAEIETAFDDYRADGFGGWPWPVDDPVHGADPNRFASKGSVREVRGPRHAVDV